MASVQVNTASIRGTAGTTGTGKTVSTTSTANTAGTISSDSTIVRTYIHRSFTFPLQCTYDYVMSHNRENLGWLHIDERERI